MFHRRSILKVHPSSGARSQFLSPYLTKGTFVVSLGQVNENFRTIVVYTFRVEVVNPFETVARVCSHKVASGKS